MTADDQHIRDLYREESAKLLKRAINLLICVRLHNHYESENVLTDEIVKEYDKLSAMVNQ